MTHVGAESRSRRRHARRAGVAAARSAFLTETLTCAAQGRWAGRIGSDRLLDPAGMEGPHVPSDVPRGWRGRPDPGRDRAFPGVQPGAQRADPGADRGELGQRPERGPARVPLPGLHRGHARGHRDRAADLLLAGLDPDHRRLLHLAAPLAGMASAGRDPGRAAGLDDHPGHHPGRPGRPGRRAHLPGPVRQADPGRGVPHRQRPHPVLRREVPLARLGPGRPGDRRPAGGRAGGEPAGAGAGAGAGRPADRAPRGRPGGRPSGGPPG